MAGTGGLPPETARGMETELGATIAEGDLCGASLRQLQDQDLGCKAGATLA